ncbi:unnamed protein product [Parnassius apollo]|uniref:(apollo) hypothetical protein n=1 Tax=Parnassius apollo TaxID=110799 RepID=A0A8S3WN74_PARAO|nr:unnamed protein product [Parnassius apollo]
MANSSFTESLAALITQYGLSGNETVLAAIATIAAQAPTPAPQAHLPPPVIASYLETRNSFAQLESAPLEMEYACSESSASTSRKRPATTLGSGSSESSDSDGTGESNFTTVTSKRNGKRAALKRTPPTSAAPAAPSTSAALDAAPVPLMSLDIPTPSKPASRCAPVLAKKQVPPPVFLRDKAKFTQLSKTCYDAGIKYDHAVNLGEAIKIIPTSIEDFRAITRLFTAERISYHTYALPEERKVRAVIRGVPFEFSNEEILEDLKSQGFPVEAVHKMHNRAHSVRPVKGEGRAPT